MSLVHIHTNFQVIVCRHHTFQFYVIQKNSRSIFNNRNEFHVKVWQQETKELCWNNRSLFQKVQSDSKICEKTSIRILHSQHSSTRSSNHWWRLLNSSTINFIEKFHFRIAQSSANRTQITLSLFCLQTTFILFDSELSRDVALKRTSWNDIFRRRESSFYWKRKRERK